MTITHDNETNKNKSYSQVSNFKVTDDIKWWEKNASVSSFVTEQDFDKSDGKTTYVGSDINTTATLNFEKLISERVFESGSKRDDDSHKPLTANLTAYARLRYGYHMRKNANKYGKGNWELGQPDVALLESIDRHLCQYMLGDRSEDHLSAIIFGIVMLMQNEQRNGIDVDKYYKKL
jgi:hypothetical protein